VCHYLVSCLLKRSYHIIRGNDIMYPPYTLYS
jgi:hypothetical protein